MNDKDIQLLMEAYDDMQQNPTDTDGGDSAMARNYLEQNPTLPSDKNNGTLSGRPPRLQGFRKRPWTPNPVLLANDIKYHIDTAIDLTLKLITALQNQNRSPELIKKAQKIITAFDPFSITLDTFRKALYEQE